MELPRRLAEQLEGKEGPTRQKAARLVVDLAHVAKAESFVEVDHAHVSGVSVITGGHGLRTFLRDLSGDDAGTVVIPTTLNSAGCDREKMEEMGISWPNFLEQQFEIVQAYDRLGIEATLSCTPYDRNIEVKGEIGSWAESNAVCYSNTWTSLITNRESGLSALATALTGYAPAWGFILNPIENPTFELSLTVLWKRFPIIPFLVIGSEKTQNQNGTFHLGQCHTCRVWMIPFLLLGRKP